MKLFWEFQRWIKESQMFYKNICSISSIYLATTNLWGGNTLFPQQSPWFCFHSCQGRQVDAVVCIPTDRWHQILRTRPIIHIHSFILADTCTVYSLKYKFYNTTLIYVFYNIWIFFFFLEKVLLCKSVMSKKVYKDFPWNIGEVCIKAERERAFLNLHVWLNALNPCKWWGEKFGRVERFSLWWQLCKY